MNTLLSPSPVSDTQASSSGAIVATPAPLPPTDADTSPERLTFNKFLEDQRFIELLLERSLPHGSLTRVATRVPAQPVAPGATILQRFTTSLAFAIGHATRAVRQFRQAPVLPYAQLWEANFLVAQVSGRHTPQCERLSAGDTFSVDGTPRSDQWLRR
jgi:hypothetical protein